MKEILLSLMALVFTTSVAFADEFTFDDELEPEPEPEVPSLVIETFSPKIFLVDQPGQSCKMQIMNPTGPNDLTGMKLVFGALKLNWPGAASLRLEYMKVTLTSDQLVGGQQEFKITGQDLGYLWQGSPGLIDIYPADENQTTTPSCNYELGGIRAKNANEEIKGTGRILLYATGIIDDQFVTMTSEANFEFETIP